MGIRRRLLWALRQWEDAQVDLNGHYSVARFSQFTAYTQHTSWCRVVLRLLLTPLPCVIILILLDCVHLEPPTAKPLESPKYFVRGYVITLIMTVGILEQLRHHVPGLQLTRRVTVSIAWLASTVGVASGLLWSVLIGHPLPFSMLVAAPPWAAIQVACLYWRVRHVVRVHPVLRNDLVAYTLFSQVRLSLLLVYPAYMFAFVSLDGVAQTAFVLLLSVIKFAAKNLMGRCLRDHDDLKPEALIFNVEVFHALFVSYSMQNATSMGAALVLMAIDVVHAWLSFVDVHRIIRELHELRQAMATRRDTASFTAIETNLLSLTGTILERNPLVRDHHSIRPSTWASVAPLASMRNLARAVVRTLSTVGVFDRDRRTSRALTAIHPTAELRTAAPTKSDLPVPPPQAIAAVSGPTLSATTQSSDAVALVRKTLQLLYVIEFIVLIEYVEIVVPFIFNTYMLAMFYLPNRAYYPLLKSMSDEQLRRSVVNVSMYALLEVVSFVTMSVVLWRRLRFSVVHQLAFVLDEHWIMVQSGLIMWVVYIVESSLEHVGFDYTFRFNWLKVDHPGTTTCL